MDSRRGLEMWGPVGRWVFLNWPRGSWQYDLICGAIIVGLFVFPNPEPQALDVDRVLAAIAAADAELDSFTAEMVRTERVVLFDDEESQRGNIAFLKPDYVRMEMQEPTFETIVIGDGEVTHYMPRIKQARVFSIEESGAQGGEWTIPGLASSAELRRAYDVSLDDTRPSEADGATLYVLTLVPKEGTEPAKRWKTITLEVAEGEWHPARRIVLEEHHGDTETIDLSNVVRNPELDADDFELELPGDVEIIKQTGAITP